MKAVILAGGSSSRFPVNKLFYPLNGKPLIYHTYYKVTLFFNEVDVFFIASEENLAELEDMGFHRVLIDNIPLGPISGIYCARKLGDIFVFGGDMPCINPGLLREMYSTWITHRYQAVVPGWSNGYLEPLHSIYSKSLLPLIKERIEGEG